MKWWWHEVVVAWSGGDVNVLFVRGFVNIMLVRQMRR